MADAGVVDQDVDMAEACQRRVGHCLNRSRVGHVDGLCDGGWAGLPGHFVCRVAVDISDHYPRAFGHEFGDDTGAKARSPAGYNCGFAVQSHVISPVCACFGHTLTALYSGSHSNRQ